jgi:hypothetical protein
MYVHFFLASIDIKYEEMKRTQYVQSSHARVNQSRLCRVIGEEKEKKKKSGQSRNTKERKKRE